MANNSFVSTRRHPPSTLYRLLMGDEESKRDHIAAGHVLTSLFLTEIAPGGTNFPHHHEREEEIYLVLDGHGDMVVGGGTNGIEGPSPSAGFWSAHLLAPRFRYRK